MITLSEAVLDELKRLRGRTERTFRIEPGCSCCHSPTLELILDEPEEDDVTTEVSGFYVLHQEAHVGSARQRPH